MYPKEEFLSKTWPGWIGIGHESRRIVFIHLVDDGPERSETELSVRFVGDQVRPISMNSKTVSK